MKISSLVTIVSAAPQSDKRVRRQVPSDWVPDCPNRNSINWVPGDCTKFYLCDRGIPNVIQTCGPGTAYSTSLKICVFPSQANCDAAFRQPVTTTTTTTTQAPTEASTTATTPATSATSIAPIDTAWTPDCAVDANGINFVPGVCTDFYLCDRGIPNVIQTCGPGTVYSPQLKVCVFPSQTDCDAAFRQPDALTTSTTQAPTEAPTDAAWTPDCAVDNNGINFVPGVCTDFYLCDRGIPNVIQTCGPGTVYSPQLKVCVFPSQTDCDAAFRQPNAATTTEVPTTTTTEATTVTTEMPKTTTTTEATTTSTTTTTQAPTEAPTEASTTSTTEATTTTTPTEAPATSSTTEASSTESPTISGIHQMALAILDGTGDFGFSAVDAIDYGCAGRGSYNAFSKTLGRQVDPVDKAFFIWKKCIQCATGEDEGMIQAYNFDLENDSCVNSPVESRSICECDRILVNALYNANPLYANWDGDLCVKGVNNGPKKQCCNWNGFMFAGFNPDKQCCSDNGPKKVGSC